MQYPFLEQRMAREEATRKLSVICERLDTCSRTEVQVKNRFFHLADRVFDVSVQRVWVVGSYARGALTCGDVDIVVELAQGNIGFERQINRNLLKSPARVSVFTGTPLVNSSGAEFKEARPLWEKDGNWRDALASIESDNQASRFAREDDAIPVRIEQLTVSYIEQVDMLLERHKAGHLTWEFIPFENVETAPVSFAASPNLENLKTEAHHFGVSKKSEKLLPYVAAHSRHSSFDVTWEYERENQFSRGHTLYLLGVFPEPSLLDNPGYNEIVVVPHLNVRGPNGLWVIRRAPKHPLYARFENCGAWVVTDPTGHPVVCSHSSYHGTGRVAIVSLYSSEAAALAYAQESNEHFRKNDPDYDASDDFEVRYLYGAELVSQAILACDVLEGDVLNGSFSARGADLLSRAKLEAEFEYRGLDDLEHGLRRTAPAGAEALDVPSVDFCPVPVSLTYTDITTRL